MIIAGIFFDNSKRDDVVVALRHLPEPLKPVIYSADEEKRPKGNLVSNEKKFDLFRRKNTGGFFLHSEKALFDLSFPQVGKASVFIELADDSLFILLTDYLEGFAKLGIDFGFAAESEEYSHRNRHFITQGANKIESWVGRDLYKYLPGFYWLTFVSNDVVKQHGIDIDSISRSAEHVGNCNGALIRFFDDPRSWRNYADLLDDCCESSDGVFTIKDVEKSVSNEMNFLELNAALAQWK
ncbi:hypothetical protein A7985_25240 [Pseudoalteromonas luteoviolacea]|uniref:Uncharacterized protein n=1 Tax=Pseudoalteromonas luteoviolacea TaxID=43657 RepID=A0A1C0TIS0_9GAMM|nr:hypothetical protein [Pseudoalteromonas luteoviolacea]OCQ17909.1 hypothetical protein A7985_25240 [Pseudoalteromonas luteoviolacea]